MIRMRILLCVFMLLASSCGPKDADLPRVMNGTLDLTGWNFNRPVLIPLRGDWNFAYGRFESPGSRETQIDGTIALPDSWNSFVKGGTQIGPHGYGTFLLKIKIPKSETKRPFAMKIPIAFTAFELWVDSNLLYTAGRIGKSEESEIPAFKPGFIIFYPKDDIIDITIRCSNWNHRSGGLIALFYFGDSDQVIRIRERYLFSEFFLFGAILIMAFYHFALFTLRREDTGTFWFGVICLATSIRILANGNYWLMEIIPSMSWEVLRKIEYFTFLVMIPSLAFFVENTFGKPDRKKALLITTPSALYGITVLFTKSGFYSNLLLYYQAYVVALILYLIYLLIHAIIQRRRGIVAFLIGGIVMIAAGINDLLASHQISPVSNLIPAGLFIFILSQSYLLSMIFAKTYSSLRQVTDHLRKTNEVFGKFVPEDFLKLMHIEDVTHVRLGDQIQADLTVLFADVINFTSLSENMSPSENFGFINRLLERLGPVVRKNDGFIDKYLGDGIMALFPKSAANAVVAAIQMQQEIRAYNEIRKNEGKSPVGIGIGIHHGSAMLGTVGEAGRMDATVISDAVNLSSRIEGLTRAFGTPILITRDVLGLIEDRMAFEARYMGRVQVKGKKRLIEIYEILNGLSEEEMHLRKSTRIDFEKGISLYFQREFSEAVKIFGMILKIDPTDHASRKYIEKSEDPHENI